MPDTQFLHKLSNLIGAPILKSLPMSGGDISDVTYLETKDNRFVLKSGSGTRAKNILRSEVAGLEIIRNTQTIAVPSIHKEGELNGSYFILMEFIESKTPEEKDFVLLASNLAALHQQVNNSFGLLEDNYIGTLLQSNVAHQNWLDFYIHERLSKQFNLAASNGFYTISEIPSAEDMKNRLQHLLDDIKPSLIHGDLWSGNFLISSDGIPYLIDPSVYYGHHEVDIAMSRLFGGFSQSFYRSYHDRIPADSHTSDRIKIYQLYYLLVHLNMFGRSYFPQVEALRRQYLP